MPAPAERPQVQGGLCECCHQSSAVLQLFAHMDLSFDILSDVTGLDLKDRGLTSQGLHKDLHLCVGDAAWLPH